MKGFRFGYVVQLDLPGGPIKIGQSGSPRTRLQTFSAATPCAARMVGITFRGDEREREMLAATDDRKIKGEWRYPTRELLALLGSYHDAGEWFIPVDDHHAHFKAARVVDRVAECAPDLNFTICPNALGYHWANSVLSRVHKIDPTLPLDWAGFVPATDRPTLLWPRTQALAA
ncbi:hypothetical protein [Sphingopyxis witflariensis]|uniref:GIY-YIG nuclease family protein n=1 Tax=Sphingopyxis witflariensis TaxID=173675 RepID=A0A246JYB3_9SPHN|nr:hypothetical protein [Sphingopyxis witflariensis]OWQ97997.1 hypothetical protein CDQ91_10275 [Sphingopyxis witflariensis]